MTTISSGGKRILTVSHVSSHPHPRLLGTWMRSTALNVWMSCLSGFCIGRAQSYFDSSSSGVEVLTTVSASAEDFERFKAELFYNQCESKPNLTSTTTSSFTEFIGFLSFLISRVYWTEVQKSSHWRWWYSLGLKSTGRGGVLLKCFRDTSAVLPVIYHHSNLIDVRLRLFLIDLQPSPN